MLVKQISRYPTNEAFLKAIALNGR
jgi:hypothetical protein